MLAELRTMLKTPIIVINYKSYPTSIGRKGIDIAKHAEAISKEYGITIIIAPPATMISRIASVVEMPVFSQHVDPVKPGGHTGYITVDAIKDAGGSGSIVNHSEHKLILSDIYKVVKLLRQAGLYSLVCADNPDVAKAAASLGPDIVAVEPPELIGTGIPVSRAKPEVVRNSVEKIRSINRDVIILTGAGISTGDDVKAAIKLGTQGVLVASAIMKAKDPRTVIEDMAKKALKALDEA